MIKELILSNKGKCSFAYLETITNPIKTKKARSTKLPLSETFPGHTAIYKIAGRNVSIGNSYEKAVNNRLDKKEIEFDFKAMPRTWGERIGNSAIIEHKGKYYLEYFYLNVNKSKEIYIWEDGSTLTPEELTTAKADFFAIVKESNRQAEAGLDKEEQILINTVSIDNVKVLHAFGEKLENNILEIVNS